MIIKPFCGIRPKKEYVSKITTPPYDVVSREYVREVLSKNHLSFFKVTRTDGLFDDSINEYDNIIYEKARENWLQFLREGTFIYDDSSYFYILSQTFKGRKRVGLYALISMKDYKYGRIKKHELTRKDKLLDRTKHIKVVKAQTGPVMLFFEDNYNFKELIKPALIERPIYEFSDESGVLNKLWILNDIDYIHRIMDFFKNIDFIFIADGHHRAEAAYSLWLKSKYKSEYNPNSWLFSVIFAHDDLPILPYNRVVKQVDNFVFEDFINSISNKFYVRRVKNLKPGGKGDIRFYCQGMCFSIKLRSKKSDDSVENLDVSILHNYILQPYFDIKDPRVSDKIQYIGGYNSIEQIKEKVDKGEAVIGFSLHSIDIGDIIKISVEDKIMPPKSTWFEPKLRDGIIVYSMENKKLLEKI